MTPEAYPETFFSKMFTRGKRGQMKLSFGMIFSIILIIIFVSFSFFAIQKFLDIGNTAQIAKFTNDLQADIDKVWRGSQSSQERSYFLPSKIEFVCFTDYSEGGGGEHNQKYSELRRLHQEYENLFFYPIGSSQGLDSKEMHHINLSKITEEDNPFCLENDQGKIKLSLQKEYGEALVTIGE